MFAILLDAIECFQKYAGDETNRVFEEWIFDYDHGWSFSFINIPEAVDISPTYLRKGLLEWEKERFQQSLFADWKPFDRINSRQEYFARILDRRAGIYFRR